MKTFLSSEIWWRGLSKRLPKRFTASVIQDRIHYWTSKEEKNHQHVNDQPGCNTNSSIQLLLGDQMNQRQSFCLLSNEFLPHWNSQSELSLVHWTGVYFNSYLYWSTWHQYTTAVTAALEAQWTLNSGKQEVRWGTHCVFCFFKKTPGRLNSGRRVSAVSVYYCSSENSQLQQTVFWLPLLLQTILQTILLQTVRTHLSLNCL